MSSPLRLGLYATDTGQGLTLRLTLRVPCPEHGMDYLCREVTTSSLRDAPDVWTWGQSVLAYAAEEALCCAEGWAAGVGLDQVTEEVAE